ncbi:MAG: alpha-glucan phosphorylase [Deltaproteobacteria bacterium RIFCSPLOWO2_12_55_13]|nr:MAG: alpha-glucan phosphorylase [Deltaproteobacteria bacterium RIFCSPLOWO2_12_55_13]
MEIAVDAEIPTYAGGLGVLAGDTIRSAVDLKVPMVAVTLLYRKGYFYQTLDASGWQREEPVEWVVDDFLEEMPQRAAVALEGRSVHIRSWKYEVSDSGGFKVPVYFLDSDLPENSEGDRTLTHSLYGGDQRYRLCQEAILGIGGVRMLRALGYHEIERFHMNDGHASLLVLELLDEEAGKNGGRPITHDDVEAVRRKCVFTTHTPVPAARDQFPKELAERVLGEYQAMSDIKDLVFCGDVLDMTFLGFNLSHFINGVAKKHSEVARLMFAGYLIDAITNGVHAATWVAEPFHELYDRHIRGWRLDNFSLRYALSIPKEEVWKAHNQVKKRLLQYLNRETNVGMDVDVLTIGFARRMATYKRADLLFTDPERLKGIASKAGPFQLVYAGKAHPQDQAGKELIQRIFRIKDALAKNIKMVYLENYDLELGKMITAGVDVWLNTPQPPLEASGTSGMKAALNGVPSLSVLDGWWIEGCIEGVTGWSIGENERGTEEASNRSKDASSLYDKLEQVIIPLFYHNRDRFIDVMLHSIALNGSFFNTHRMIQQYVLKAYFE